MIPGSGRPVKLLAEGTAAKNLTVKVNAVSTAAQKKIEDAGGRVELLA
jgi:ribosomal protein L15